MNKPKVAFIGTGGTISSHRVHPVELQDYAVHDNRMHAGQIVGRFATVPKIAEVIPVDFRNVSSTDIYFAERRDPGCARRDQDRRERKHMPDSEFAVSGLPALPRAHIVYPYPAPTAPPCGAFVAADPNG